VLPSSLIFTPCYRNTSFCLLQGVLPSTGPSPFFFLNLNAATKSSYSGFGLSEAGGLIRIFTDIKFSCPSPKEGDYLKLQVYITVVENTCVLRVNVSDFYEILYG